MNQQALFFDAGWTGTTSSAVGTVLTNSLTLPKGRYLLYGQAPVASTSASTAWCVLNGNSNLSHRTATYYSMLTYGKIIDYIVAIRDNATAWLEASSSASITFDYLSRGFIRAIKIGEYE